MFLIGMRKVEAVFVFLSHQQHHRRNGYGPAYSSYTSLLSSSSLWRTLLALVMTSFLILSSSPSTIQAAVDSSESDGSGREFQWQIITKRNFSSQIRLHPHILLMVTVPWSGESRSLMKQISLLVANKQKNFGSLKLMLLYKNEEKMLADAINAAEEISILCYRYSLSYKYRGRLRAQNILSSVHFLMLHPPEQLPLESLNTPEELKAVLQSSDKTLLLLEFCGWTQALLAKGKDNGTENAFDIPFGVGFTAETNKSVAADGKKSQKGIEDAKMTCGIQNFISGIPWVGEFSSVNDSDFLEAKTTRPTLGTCSFEEFQQFDAFFSNLTTVAREFFLPPERLRFGLVPERSLLSSLGVGDSGSWLSSLDVGDSGSWLMILHISGCPSCSKVLRHGDDIESSLRMQNPFVIELGHDGPDAEPALPANKPSVLLFIDRSSDSLKTRRKSKEAIDAFRHLALHYHTSHGISEQSNVRTDKNIFDNYQALKSMPRDQRFKMSLTSRNVALEDKMSVVIVNEGEHVTLDKAASGLQGNSLQEILAYVLDQKNEVKLSSLAKEVGFQLLSEDLDIKVQEALPTQAKVLESDQVLPKPTEDLPEAVVGLHNDQTPFIDSTSEMKHEEQYKRTNSDEASQSTEEKTYDTSRQFSGKPDLLMASTFSLEQQEHRPTDADQSSRYSEEETTSERSKQLSGKSDHFHGNQVLGSAEKGKMDWKMLSQVSNVGKEKLHLKNFEGSFFFSDGGYQLLRTLTAGSKIPSVVIVHPILQKHYVLPEGTVFSYSSLSDFLDGFLNGSLLPYQLSESVVLCPREAPRPPFVNLDFHEVDSIPRVTTHSFSELVIGFNPSDNLNGGNAWTEDVLVLFSNSWCGFCHRMELVVREVYRAFKHYSTMLKNDSRNDRSVLPDDLKDIARKLPLIYLMDCTLNECSLILRSLSQRELFPSLLLFPAERKNTIPYEGDVAVSDIIKFIIDHGSNARNLGKKKGILQNGVEQDSMKQNLHDYVSQLFINKKTPLSKEKYHEVLLKYRIPERVVRYNQKGPHKSNGLNGAGPRVVVGSLLVATEKLLSVHPFDKSTILIVKADQGTGFHGLIVNKHISWDSLDELEEGLKLLTEARLSFGGPVLKQGMPFVALTRRAIKNQYTEVLPNVYFLDQQATIHEIEALKLHNHSVFDYWFFLGYSRWGWDQLFAEISHGAWNISSGNIEQLDWPWR